MLFITLLSGLHIVDSPPMSGYCRVPPEAAVASTARLPILLSESLPLNALCLISPHFLRTEVLL